MASQRTLSILKPDATRRNITGRVNATIEEAGLRIVAQKRVKWSRDEAQAFYKVHKDRPFYNDLVAFMTSGPIVLQVLEADDAIAKYREVMGATDPAKAAPGTIRAQFAESIEANSVHGSDSPENAGAGDRLLLQAGRDRRLMWVAGYVAAIVLVNWLFAALPMVETPLGAWPPASLIVGFVLILRDMAQREVGHYVLIAMLAAGVITYVMVDPFIAVASVSAFLVSETADWIVYTVTKRPLRDRILASSAVSSPLDSVVFLGLIGFLSPASFILQTLSKFAGALVIWGILRHRASRACGA
jgi:nucleoside-diphosphate kinase